jgi:hypothetical protein
VIVGFRSSLYWPIAAFFLIPQDKKGLLHKGYTWRLHIWHKRDRDLEREAQGCYEKNEGGVLTQVKDHGPLL